MLGFAPQPSLEDAGDVAFSGSQDDRGYSMMAAGITYTQLWEAVRTTWHREPSERSTVRHVLAGHARYILVNQYRRELGLSENPADQAPSEGPSPAVTGQTNLLINDVEVPGVEVDADPLVYGLGAELPDGGVVTAVLPRAELKNLQLHFTTRNQQPRPRLSA